MDKKLTDNEIIKALECCSKGKSNCYGKCPRSYNNCLTISACRFELLGDVLDLLNRLKAINERLRECAIENTKERDSLSAEIERLKKGETLSKSGFWNLLCGALVFTKTLEEYNEFRRRIKSEAIKEFAERVKGVYDGFDEQTEEIHYENLICAIGNLVKEMTGQNDFKE